MPWERHYDRLDSYKKRWKLAVQWNINETERNDVRKNKLEEDK